MKIGFCSGKVIVQSGYRYIFNLVDNFKKRGAEHTEKTL
jgi:hypothetical protein